MVFASPTQAAAVSLLPGAKTEGYGIQVMGESRARAGRSGRALPGVAALSASSLTSLVDAGECDEEGLRLLGLLPETADRQRHRQH